MRRLMVMLIAVLTVPLLALGVANAESQTVPGVKYGGQVGDITKMTAANGQTAVTTRVFGLGRPCGGAQSLWVHVKTRLGKTRYFAQGSCTAGVQWDTALYYTATGDTQDQVRVRCRDFEFTRVKATGAYRIVMPRKCLDNAPNRIKVMAEGNNYGSATGGKAGPTAALDRG